MADHSPGTHRPRRQRPSSRAGYRVVWRLVLSRPYDLLPGRL